MISTSILFIVDFPGDSIYIFSPNFWRVRLVVRTPASHVGSMGSTPVRATAISLSNREAFSCFPFCNTLFQNGASLKSIAPTDLLNEFVKQDKNGHTSNVPGHPDMPDVGIAWVRQQADLRFDSRTRYCHQPLSAERFFY